MNDLTASEAFTLRIEKYEGPMDLLIALISKHKIDIFDIPISDIADQYMEYINMAAELNMELASDFIYMASQLMEIKSRMLLPKNEKEADPRLELIDAILEYKRAKATAEFLKNQGNLYYNRFTKSPDESDGTYNGNHDVEILIEAFKRMKIRRDIVAPVADTTFFNKLENEKYYTVEEKSTYLVDFLSSVPRARFRSLFEDCESANEVVALFLALLDLVREGICNIEKGENDIFISLDIY